MAGEDHSNVINHHDNNIILSDFQFFWPCADIKVKNGLPYILLQRLKKKGTEIWKQVLRTGEEQERIMASCQSSGFITISLY